MNYVIKMYYEYLRYLIFAKKPHKLEPGFLKEFYTNCIYKKKEYEEMQKIETVRQNLLTSPDSIKVTDYGKGSKKQPVKDDNYPKLYSRRVKDIAKYSLKTERECILFANMVEFMRPERILELGTSFGITTSYMAMAQYTPAVVTVEGCPNTALIAKSTFKTLGFENIELIIGSFDDIIPSQLSTPDKFNMAIIDGNHAYKPVVEYFNALAQQMPDNGVIVIDDIRWSLEMIRAWEEIKKHPEVILSIDLFSIGIVFFNKALPKEDVMLWF